MYPPIPPTFQIGPITIHWYGITMVTAIFVGAWVASRYVARKGQDGSRVWDMLLWVLIPAFIGARLYYVFIQSPRGPNGLGHYLAHPLDILAIWQGGIHIYGAFIFGGAALPDLDLVIDFFDSKDRLDDVFGQALGVTVIDITAQGYFTVLNGSLDIRGVDHSMLCKPVIDVFFNAIVRPFVISGSAA